MVKPRVYMVGPSRRGPMKIGVTAAGDIQHRINNLQPGYPGRLRSFGEYPCPNPWSLEIRIHELLKPRKIFGEWFRVSFDDALQAIEAAMTEREELQAKVLGHHVATNNKWRRRMALMRRAGPLWNDATRDRMSVEHIAEHVGLSAKALFVELGRRPAIRKERSTP